MGNNVDAYGGSQSSLETGPVTVKLYTQNGQPLCAHAPIHLSSNCRPPAFGPGASAATRVLLATLLRMLHSLLHLCSVEDGTKILSDVSRAEAETERSHVHLFKMCVGISQCIIWRSRFPKTSSRYQKHGRPDLKRELRSFGTSNSLMCSCGLKTAVRKVPCIATTAQV